MQTDNIVNLLNKLLDYEVLLLSKTTGFAWNLRDPEFDSLHRQLMYTSESFMELINQIGRRARILGRTPHISPRKSSQHMCLYEHSAEVISNEAMLHELFYDNLRVLFFLKDNLKKDKHLIADFATKKLFIGIKSKHESIGFFFLSQFRRLRNKEKV